MAAYEAARSEAAALKEAKERAEAMAEDVANFAPVAAVQVKAQAKEAAEAYAKAAAAEEEAKAKVEEAAGAATEGADEDNDDTYRRRISRNVKMMAEAEAAVDRALAVQAARRFTYLAAVREALQRGRQNES